MRSLLMFGEPENSYLRRFFDGVDKAITEEMQSGRSLLEENLTFVLARLLDEQSTFQRILDYPLEKLNADLEACGSGAQVSIEFETNEHKKSFEAAVSHADLGIVVRREGSIFGGPYTKGIIVQSKKLYHWKNRYSLRSAYEGFDPVQFTNLRDIASKYGRRGVFYFLYNPKIDAFPEEEAKILVALEARVCSLFGGPTFPIPYWHPELEYFFHKFLRRRPFVWSASTSELPNPDHLRDERNRLLLSRPGLRVLGISSIEAIVESNKTIQKSFRLEECYRYAFSGHWFENSGAVPFLPLSSFIVDLVLGCHSGSDNENLVRIAEGKPPEPGPGDNVMEPAQGLAVRHTLKITFKSTLPKMDLRFHE